MAQFNRPPTAVTIAPVHEKTGLALLVDRYWKAAVGVAAVGTGVLLFWQYSRQQHRAQQKAGWERIRAVTEEDASGRLTGSPEALVALGRELKDSEAAPWAEYLAATSATQESSYALAESALSELQRDHPSHPLVVQSFPFAEAGETTSPAAELQRRTRAWTAWTAANREEAPEQPPEPADATGR